MKDIEVTMANHPGMLALLGETLGSNDVSLDGGGVFATGDQAIAHFLVKDAEKARKVLTAADFSVKINEVLIQRLRQDVPGQLGSFARKMAEVNVNILVQYSDHAGQLIVVVDDYEKGRMVSDEWMRALDWR